MDKISRSIDEYLETGEYYQDALEWYNFKYIYPYHQRTFCAFFIIILFVLVFISLYNVMSLFPTVENHFYYLKSNDSISKIRYISEVKEISNDYQENLTKKIIVNYVKTYEQYDYNNLRNQYTGIYRLSDAKVFEQFKNNMDLNNPDSPLHKFGRYRKNRTIITSVVFPQKITKGNNIAIIDIKNTIYGVGVDKNIEEYKQAIVNFQVSDIEEFDINKPSFKFVVVGYKSSILEQK
jgi:type IV secretion system protein VirB8